MFKAILDLLRTRAIMKDVYRDVRAIIDMASSHLGAAAGALIEGEPLDFDVYAADRRLNKRVIAIRRRIVEHVTLNRPDDIVGELVFLTVINDIERVGDYAKTLVDVLKELGGALPEGPLRDGLAEQRDILLSTFPEVEHALLDGDPNSGKAAIASLDQVRRLSEDLLSALYRETEMTPAHAISLGLTARVFKRAAKHLRNVASATMSTFINIGYTDAHEDVADED